jgi:hypothetical protein
MELILLIISYLILKPYGSIKKNEGSNFLFLLSKQSSILFISLSKSPLMKIGLTLYSNFLQ